MIDFFAQYWYAIFGPVIGVIALFAFLRGMRSPAARIKLRNYLVAVVILGVITGAVASAWVMNSDAYKVARDYVTTAPEVVSQFGAVSNVSLRSGSLVSDSARYSFAIEGAKSNGVLTFVLKKDPTWRVEHVESGD